MNNKVINKISKILDLLILAAFAVSVLVLVLFTNYSVIMRYVFKNPPAWVEEVQMIFIVWLTYFGCCTAFLSNGNISISLLVDKFPEKFRRIFDVVLHVFVCAVLVFLAWLAISRMNSLMNSHQVTAVLHIPKYIQYSVVSVSCVIMIINHILYCINGSPDSEKEVADL